MELELISKELELGYKTKIIAKFNENMTVSSDKEDILIYGRNGAGKTTLLKTLSGLIYPAKGRLHKELANYEVNYISEDLLFHDDLKVKNIIKSLIDKQYYDKVYKIAENLGLNTKAAWRELSKGNKQRVRLLVGSFATIKHEKSIQLYDEPLSGLDHSTCNFFTQLWKEQREDESFSSGIRVFSMHGEHVTQHDWDQEWEIQGDGMGMSYALQKPYIRDEYVHSEKLAKKEEVSTETKVEELEEVKEVITSEAQSED